MKKQEDNNHSPSWKPSEKGIGRQQMVQEERQKGPLDLFSRRALARDLLASYTLKASVALSVGQLEEK